MRYDVIHDDVAAQLRIQVQPEAWPQALQRNRKVTQL